MNATATLPPTHADPLLCRMCDGDITEATMHNAFCDTCYTRLRAELDADRRQPLTEHPDGLRVKRAAALNAAMVDSIRGDARAERHHYERARELDLQIYAAESRDERQLDYAAARHRSGNVSPLSTPTGEST